jgi:DNA-binding protein YbaB
MMNVGNMMKQVQAMQAKMADMQNRLGEMELIGQSGGEMVVATMNGKGDLKKIKIDPKSSIRRTSKCWRI